MSVLGTPLDLQIAVAFDIINVAIRRVFVVEVVTFPFLNQDNASSQLEFVKLSR